MTGGRVTDETSFEPTLATIKKLFALSPLTCNFDPEQPNGACEVPLAQPHWPRVNAHICHIEGERPTSARYRGDMTNAERRDFDNLILLCPNHHHVIDALEPDRYYVERLRAMKQRGIEAAQRSTPPQWKGDKAEEFAVGVLREYRIEQVGLAWEAREPPLSTLSVTPATQPEEFDPDAGYGDYTRGYGGDSANLQFPIEDYEARTVLELLPLLPVLSVEELQQVRQREQLGQRRVDLLERIESLLRGES